MDSKDNIRHWAPSVRMHLALWQLLSNLDFSIEEDGSARLHHLASPEDRPQGEDAAVCRKRYEIVAVKRPDVDFFRAQTKLVEDWAELRDERTAEILAQLTPQFPFWNSVADLQLDRRAHTLELMWLALSFASYVEMRFKHALACARPDAYSAKVQPIIPVPGHGSFPSGHATEAYMMAHLLENLLINGNELRAQLQALAERTSINRTVAGVHFPVDSMVGRCLGNTLAEYFLTMTGKCAFWRARTFDVEKLKIKQTDDFAQPKQLPKGEQVNYTMSAADLERVHAVMWFWEQADAEWPKAGQMDVNRLAFDVGKAPASSAPIDAGSSIAPGPGIGQGEAPVQSSYRKGNGRATA